MSNVTELMAAGLPWQAASQIGQGVVTSFTPAGSSQTDATALTSSFSKLATASTAGVILPTATGAPPHVIYNGSGANQNIYPASGESINGSSANTAFTLTSAKSAICIPSGMNWIIVLSA